MENSGVIAAQPQAVSQSSTPGEKKLRPCCACPATKRMRDQCILNNGQDSCQAFIDAHNECLRSKGFNV